MSVPRGPGKEAEQESMRARVPQWLEAGLVVCLNLAEAGMLQAPHRHPWADEAGTPGHSHLQTPLLHWNEATVRVSQDTEAAVSLVHRAD